MNRFLIVVCALLVCPLSLATKPKRIPHSFVPFEWLNARNLQATLGVSTGISSELVSRLRQSTIRVENTNDDGNGGSGIIIAPGLVLTAAHVVGKMLPQELRRSFAAASRQEEIAVPNIRFSSLRSVEDITPEMQNVISATASMSSHIKATAELTNARTNNDEIASIVPLWKGARWSLHRHRVHPFPRLAFFPKDENRPSEDFAIFRLGEDGESGATRMDSSHVPLAESEDHLATDFAIGLGFPHYSLHLATHAELASSAVLYSASTDLLESENNWMQKIIPFFRGHMLTGAGPDPLESQLDSLFASPSGRAQHTELDALLFRKNPSAFIEQQALWQEVAALFPTGLLLLSHMDTSLGSLTDASPTVEARHRLKWFLTQLERDRVIGPEIVTARAGRDLDAAVDKLYEDAERELGQKTRDGYRALLKRVYARTGDLLAKYLSELGQPYRRALETHEKNWGRLAQVNMSLGDALFRTPYEWLPDANGSLRVAATNLKNTKAPLGHTVSNGKLVWLPLAATHGASGGPVIAFFRNGEERPGQQIVPKVFGTIIAVPHKSLEPLAHDQPFAQVLTHKAIRKVVAKSPASHLLKELENAATAPLLVSH